MHNKYMQIINVYVSVLDLQSWLNYYYFNANSFEVKKILYKMSSSYSNYACIVVSWYLNQASTQMSGIVCVQLKYSVT